MPPPAGPQPQPDVTLELFAAVQRWVAAVYPYTMAVRLTIDLYRVEGAVELPVPLPPRPQ